MEPRPPSPTALAIYRLILRLTPHAYRRAFGTDQLALFIRIHGEERPAGSVRGIVWLAQQYLSAIVAAGRQHLDRWRRRSRRRFTSRIGADTRHAVRALKRTPGYSVAITAVGAAGVALTATVFALVDGVLFKPLPYPAPGELFMVRGIVPNGAEEERALAPREIALWRSALPEYPITGTGEVVGYGTLGVINGPTIWSRRVDAAFFTTIGVRPLVGGFAPDDYVSEQPGRAIISFRLWQQLFAGDANIIGRPLQTPRFTLRVAGVLPRDFVFPDPDGQVTPDILLPLAPSPQAAMAAERSLSAIGRLPAGAPVEEVRQRFAAALRGMPPAAGERHGAFADAALLPVHDVLAADARPFALGAFAAAALMMLLVAVNVGGLVATRTRARAREGAARRALGASTYDIVSLQLLELAILCSAGAAAGALAARFLLAEVTRFLPTDVLLLRAPALDARVLAIAASAAMAVAMVSALLSVRATGRQPVVTLLGQGAGAPVERHRTVAHFVLEAGQVALAIALVVGGALFMTSLQRAWSTDTGYDLSGAVFLDVRLSGAPAGNHPERVLAMLAAVRRAPGVDRAAVVDTLLLADARRGSASLAPVGGPKDSDIGELIPISSDFFDLAGMRAIEGRLPTRDELDRGAPVAVVSARTARENWPGRSAVGQLMSSRRGALTVIGIVRDGRFQRLDRESAGEIYAPMRLALFNVAAPTVFVRSSLPHASALAAVLDAVRSFDANASVRRALPVEAALGESIRGRRFNAWLFGAFAVAALVIAGTGVFGLVATATAQRTREMGVRLALGSTPGALVRLLVREQLAPVVAGAVAGGVLAGWAARYVGTLLYQVHVYDPRVWLAAAVVVLSVAAVAALVPALRTTRIDPVHVLRA